MVEVLGRLNTARRVTGGSEERRCSFELALHVCQRLVGKEARFGWSPTGQLESLRF